MSRFLVSAAVVFGLTLAAFTAPAPTPGYRITIGGIANGTGADSCKACNAYNGKWYAIPAGPTAMKKQKSLLDPSGPDCFDVSGLHPTRSIGCNGGFGGEKMELIVEPGLVQVIRCGGGRVVWRGTGTGNLPLVFSQAGRPCDASAATCTVEFLPDLNGLLSDYGQP
ncbi:MAG: hypothetical protein ACR2FY_15065 [Pirellulaceae bacterium]